MKKNVAFVLWITVLGLFLGCSRNKFDIDVSGIEVNIKISRFEKDFFSADPDSLNEVHRRLYDNYGTFYKRFIENITGIGMVNDPAISYSLKPFLSDKYIREIYNDSEKKFNDDLEDVRTGLTDAFRHSLYYFPKMMVPEVVTFVSGFQYAVTVTDSVLGIGLDMYLGQDYPNYPKAGLPLYKIAVMERDYIVPDAVKSWLATEFYAEDGLISQNTLESMIRYGKIMYLLDAVLPSTEDTLKIGYTAAQLEWCEKNEFNIWAYLVDNKLLFSTDPITINKFFNDAPFTSGFPKESPPKIGIWVGWQIIRSYMENNPGINLQELMRQQDAQDILSKSKYKPGK